MFIKTLTQKFKENANANNAAAMEKYLKNHFPFYGIKTEARRQILKECLKENEKKVQKSIRSIALDLYENPHRECHSSAVELLIKYMKNNYVKSDRVLIETFIRQNSWWDTVDFLAKYLLGNYLLQYPDETDALIKRFSNSSNMWLNRSAILFQLSYKDNTNPILLFRECEKHAESKEFFIQKAIGWALREYAKINPLLVEDFVHNSDLKPLSRREALRNR